MQSGSAMLSSTVVPASRCARLPSSCVQPIAASIGHVCDVDALRHQFPRHALREPGLGLACHCESAAGRKALKRCACVREDDRSSRAVGVWCILAHMPGRLLTHQKRAERRVAKCFEHHAGVGFGDPLAKDARERARRCCARPASASRGLEQPLWNSCSTSAGLLASHAYRRAPWAVSRACSAGLSGFLAATATRIPLAAKSLAQLELMPGPPPTISATSETEGWAPRSSA